MNIKDLSKQLNDHIDSDREVLFRVQTSLDTITNNHLFHIEKSIKAIEEEVKNIKTGQLEPLEKSVIKLDSDQGWIMKIGVIIAGALLTGMVKIIFFS